MVSPFSTTSSRAGFQIRTRNFFDFRARPSNSTGRPYDPKTGDICGIVAQRPRLKRGRGFTAPRCFLCKNVVYLQRGRSGKIGTAQRGSVAAIPCVHALRFMLPARRSDNQGGLAAFERQRVAGSDGIITAIGVGFDLPRGGNKPRQLIGGMIEIKRSSSRQTILPRRSASSCFCAF